MYELLKNNKPLINKLTKAGIIDAHWIRDIEMFEDFQTIDTNCVMCKYTILADKYGLSEEGVRKRIKALKTNNY